MLSNCPKNLTFRPEGRTTSAQGDSFKKQAYVKLLFNTIAPHYDLMNLIMTFGLIRRWHRVFARLTCLNPGQHALDVCCGTGDLAAVMARQVGSGGRVVGLDFSPEMLAVARRRFRGDSPRDWIELVEGDALELPFADNSFDCAATGFALRNVTDIGRVIAEMTRVVKPGGRVVGLEMARPPRMVLRAPFCFYLERVVPLMGRWAEARFRSEAGPSPYGWLPVSLQSFPDQEGLRKIFVEAGLERVGYRNLNGGIACLHYGVKP